MSARSKIFLSSTACLLVGLVALAGCGGGSSTPPASNPTKAPSGKTFKTPGSPVEVSNGEAFNIALDSNPSTGYSWSLEGGVPEILQSTGETFVAPERDLVGAPGVQYWEFKAVKAGSGSIKFIYSRSWETGVPPANTETFNINVK